MNGRVAYPFLTLSVAAVDVTPWSVVLNGKGATLVGDFLADWDNSSLMSVRRTLRVNPRIASADVGIPESELTLAVVTRIGTGPGRLPRLIVGSEQKSLATNDEALEIEIGLDGEKLSSVLDLVTEIVLTRTPRQRDFLSPARAGERLWQDRLRVRLEGDEPRFPIEVTDLHALLGDSTAGSAPWYLHWSPHDWFRDFHGVMRLYLNSAFPELIRRVEEEDSLILQAIMADVMGQVCERLVADPEAVELAATCEPGSLGAQAATWLKLAWPGHNQDFIRALLETRPGEFRAAFLALARLEEP
jgi:hypothetical protein